MLWLLSLIFYFFFAGVLAQRRSATHVPVSALAFGVRRAWNN